MEDHRGRAHEQGIADHRTLEMNVTVNCVMTVRSFPIEARKQWQGIWSMYYTILFATIMLILTFKNMGVKSNGEAKVFVY